MSANPLVATPREASPSPWSGIWIAEDIELLIQGIENGSWIDGVLGGVSAGLDALALVTDPAGVLLQYGIAWLIEHVKPLSEALDWLAGDPAQIAAYAQTWRNVAGALRDSVADLSQQVRMDVAEWTGSAGDAYRAWAKDQQDAIGGLAKAADTMAVATESAGQLIAGVRMLVRDAIAALVSRLVVYAAELLGTAGAAAPLVLEQVTALIGSCAAKIARWLRALLSSLRTFASFVSRLGKLIEALRRILDRLRGGNRRPVRPNGPSRQELLEELSRQGIKHNPDDIVLIGKDGTGKIIFLENGNSRAGLRHITERHAADFADVGVAEEKIANLVFSAVTEGKVVGMQRTRPIYEVVFEGRIYRVAVTVGDNGFIVGANPVGR
ncbi:WXG100 family type VII secretion target [Micromonospora sp. HM5-17]|uniref:WXG100 family type VII secretion target n=1 Tax=Micromonospora sp. HM5-17 TaxID=2487710 RepID=UPI000F47F151|nr:WXG100 family type VII secretion target [Micromonospora sp. HM5-17]ROT34231.1 WXG100 family type VII secretion target [Micromonospora sp. HM5-17]